MSEISGGSDSMDMSSETETGGTETGVSVETGGHMDLGAETSSQSVEGLVSGDEVSINPAETTHGMNQILETTDTLEMAHAQAQVESVHHSALESILEHNGAYISEQDHARIEAGITSIKAMDNLGHGKTGGYHFDSKNSSIRVASLNETQRERSTIHETHHFASHNREIIVPMPDKGGLFWNWERSFWHVTTMPVGICVIRIADDVLLMCCPPAPLERYVSIRISSSRTSTSISLSISGITSHDTNDVWRFPAALNGEIRTRR